MQDMKIQLIWQVLVLCVLVNLSYQQVAQTDGDGSLFYYHQSEYPKDCSDIKDQCTDSSDINTGVYVIKPEGLLEPIEVFCDQTTEEGGWTVIQRRIDGSIDFNRDFDAYTAGFGFLNQEFWLGNNNLAYLTNQKKYELRIDMNDDSGNSINVTYRWFRTSDEDSKFSLVKLEDYNDLGGSTSDDMNDQEDEDFQILSATSCSSSGTGGWWVDESGCSRANLNNEYTSLDWLGTALSHIEMKVRPQAKE